jgi:hypothetical protein
MRLLLLLTIGAIAGSLAGCDTPEEDHSDRGHHSTISTTTTETETVRAPVTGATTTTVHSY